MYQHAIDNFKLCWESSKKKLESKSTVLPQNLSTIVAITAMFLFSIMITLTCTCTFAWSDDYSYSVVSYKFCQLLQHHWLLIKAMLPRALHHASYGFFWSQSSSHFFAIEVPSNKYEGLSPPTSRFKFCYEEPVCYHFPSNSFLIHNNTTEIGPTEYNLGTQNWNWVNKREFRTSQQSETEILYS